MCTAVYIFTEGRQPQVVHPWCRVLKRTLFSTSIWLKKVEAKERIDLAKD